MKVDKKDSAHVADRRSAKRRTDPSVAAKSKATIGETAAADDFGPWFAAQSGRLAPDFELEL